MILDLTALADEHLAAARTAPHGRSAHLVMHDGVLRQTVIALTSGTSLDEHNAPCGREPPGAAGPGEADGGRMGGGARRRRRCG